MTILYLYDTDVPVSSTKRGGQRSESDRYPTPPWCVSRLLEDEYSDLPGGKWLEPGAGEGSIIRAVNEFRSDVVWTALEIEEEDREDLVKAVGSEGTVLIENYLIPPPDSGLRNDYYVALGNPPYSLAAEFIDRSLTVSQIVVFLLRVNYLASAKRNSFMRSYPPDIWILPNRPSFRGKGTDSPEYAWLKWTQQRSETRGRLRVLNTTPKSIRAEAKLNALPIVGKRELSRMCAELTQIGAPRDEYTIQETIEDPT